MDQLIRNEQYKKPKVDNIINLISIYAFYSFSALIILKILEVPFAVFVVDSKIFWIFFLIFIISYFVVFTLRIIYKTIVIRKVVLTSSSSYLLFKNPPTGFIRVLSDKDAVKFGWIQIAILGVVWTLLIIMLVYL